MLDNKLIESALQLTGKTMEDMNILPVLCKFSIQNFCYYLLSPEFIKKYCKANKHISYWSDREELATELFGRAIYEYQSGNEQPLISLLEKIGN